MMCKYQAIDTFNVCMYVYVIFNTPTAFVAYKSIQTHILYVVHICNIFYICENL